MTPRRKYPRQSLLASAARRGAITLAVAAGTVAGVLGVASASASASAAPHQSAAAVRPGATAQSLRPGGVMTGPAQPAAARARGHGHSLAASESTNWSGYAATGSDGAFTSVSASWTQPAASCTPARGRHRQGGESFAAFWVGLDGFNSDSVEQTGTDSDCDGSTPDYYGWYEMFPADPVTFTNPVAPGDAISASVTFSGTETYTLVLTDATQGWTQTITQNETGLDRSSAEVITEAPSSGNEILPLADFGTVSYTAASANGTSLAAQNPTEINMEGDSGALKDETSAISGTGAFSDNWLRST